MPTATDDYTRPNQPSWGVSSGGYSYTAIGSSPSLSIISNTGSIISPIYICSTVAIDNLVAYSIDVTVTINSNNGKIGWSWRINGNTFYEVSIDANGILYLFAHVLGSAILVKSVSIASYVQNANFKLHIINNTNDIAVYAYLEGTVEPSTPQISLNDNNIPIAGFFGPCDTNYSGVANFFVNYTVTYSAINTVPVTTLPSGWMDAIVNLNLTNGNINDIPQTNALAPYATAMNIIRGLLLHAGNSFSTLNILNNNISTILNDEFIRASLNSFSYVIFSKLVNVAANGRYPFAIFNPSNSTRTLICTGVNVVTNYLPAATDVYLYRINVDPVYANTSEVHMDLLYGNNPSGISATFDNAVHALPAAGDFLGYFDGSTQLLDNEHVISIPPNKGMVISVNAAITNDVIVTAYMRVI